ncbi:MAG: DUF975 family protein [Spirochaetes bacterium]|nr:DUF975 family protein [Spirochaetota bacterium]
MSTGIISFSKLKLDAKTKLTGNWTNAIIVNLLYIIVAGSASSTYLLSFIFLGPVLLGIYNYYVKLVRKENPSIENLFDGFKSLKLIIKSIILFFAISLFILLWSLLFIIPGIIASLRYSMAFFILNDNPSMESIKAIELSKKMMHGYKVKLFLLYFSFIGWFFLCLLTAGIGFIWLIPYIETTVANFYMELKKASAPSREKASRKKVPLAVSKKTKKK